MRCAIIVALVSLAGCDIAARRKKLPAIPRPPAVATGPADPAAWTAAGDRACPAVETGQSLPGGPPGSTLREGRITRDPQTGRLACQVVGHDHGPATEPDGHGGTATGAYAFSKRTGPWVGRYADGRLAWKGRYTDGVGTGQWAYWSPSGAVRSTGALVDGRPAGMWAYWSERAVQGEPPERFVHYGSDKIRSGVVIDDEPVVTRALCALGLAAPRCQVIVASGLTARGGPVTGEESEAQWSLVIDGDIVANVGTRHGVGVGGGIYVGDEYARTGLRLSYRYWIEYWLAAEVAGGVLFPRGDLEVRDDRGLSARVALNFADQGSVGLEVQRYDNDGTGDKLATLLTLRVGVIPLAVLTAMALRVAAAAGGR